MYKKLISLLVVLIFVITSTVTSYGATASTGVNVTLPGFIVTLNGVVMENEIINNLMETCEEALEYISINLLENKLDNALKMIIIITCLKCRRRRMKRPNLADADILIAVRQPTRSAVLKFFYFQER